jgi:hypothetical protein
VCKEDQRKEDDRVLRFSGKDLVENAGELDYSEVLLALDSKRKTLFTERESD